MSLQDALRTPTPANDLCCSLSSGILDDAQAGSSAALFKVLAEPARLQILSLLAATGCVPMSVGEITTSLGLSQPTVSHHLKRLTDAGMLRRERVGRTVTHRVEPEPFARLRTILQMD